MRRSVQILLVALVLVAVLHPSSSWWRRRRRRRRRCVRQNCLWKKGACSVTCGRGYYDFTKTRGNSCGGSCTKPRVGCSPKKCPVNCKVSAWSRWSLCGRIYRIQQRTRTVVRSPKFGGKRCPALRETKRCKRCKPINCRWAWEPCKRLGYYYSYQSAYVVRKTSCGGNCNLPRPRRCRRTLPCGSKAWEESLDKDGDVDGGIDRMHDLDEESLEDGDLKHSILHKPTLSDYREGRQDDFGDNAKDETDANETLAEEDLTKIYPDDDELTDDNSENASLSVEFLHNVEEQEANEEEKLHK